MGTQRGVHIKNEHNGSIMTLRPDTKDKAQFDLFIPYLSDISLRDQRETMERPFFSLSKGKRDKPIIYSSPDGTVWVEVFASAQFGMATIWDADILIWAATVLTDMKRRGVNDLPRTLYFHPYDLLKAIQREVGGAQYKRLKESLDRLKSTVIRTNIRGDKKHKRAMFGWIDKWEVVEAEDDKGQPKMMSLTLSDWLYKGIINDGGVLTIHPDYFRLTGGIERCLYRMARKHAGKQQEGWRCTIKVLHSKSGCDSPLKKFSFMLRKVVKANALPEYDLKWIEPTEGQEPAIRIIRRNLEGTAYQKPECPNSL